MEEGIRINKFLASCGLTSRRKAEELIEEGRVTINGRTVTRLAERVLPEDSVKVDGRRVRPPQGITILFYKPKGYLCTQEDPQGRQTIYDLLPPKFHRLSYVGRLDKDSEGLLLLTSLGELVETLTHPRHEIEKEYHVLSNRPLDEETMGKFRQGVRTEEGVAYATRVDRMKGNWASVVLRQGLKRQIRLMYARFGFQVKKLVRVRIGELVAPRLAPGAWVELDQEALSLLMTNPSSS